MRFPRRLEGSIDVAGGHSEGEERMEGEGREEGGRVEEAWYARAVVWMRGLGFDPKSETEIEGTRRSRDCREGAGGREGGTVERRGEERSVGEREARGLDGLDSPARRY